MEKWAQFSGKMKYFAKIFKLLIINFEPIVVLTRRTARWGYWGQIEYVEAFFITVDPLVEEKDDGETRRTARLGYWEQIENINIRYVNRSRFRHRLAYWPVIHLSFIETLIRSVSHLLIIETLILHHATKSTPPEKSPPKWPCSLYLKF